MTNPFDRTETLNEIICLAGHTSSDVAESRRTDWYRKVSQAIKAGATPGDVAKAYDLEVERDEDGVGVILPGWYADDGNAEMHFPDATSAEEAARAYVDGGDWGPSRETQHVTVRAYRVVLSRLERPECPEVGQVDVVEDHIDTETHIVAVEPTEPDCISVVHRGRVVMVDHEWTEVPGSLRGSGGGVRWIERCEHCDTERETDTWAQVPETGQQPVTTVTYLGDVYDDEELEP